ncbi:MAG: hypothetical protein K2X49_00940 [Acetobacteraceae bacterium]|nr:hypothetical protein [Acetobacteraceae bacterium]
MCSASSCASSAFTSSSSCSICRPSSSISAFAPAATAARSATTPNSAACPRSAFTTWVRPPRRRDLKRILYLSAFSAFANHPESRA